MRQEMQAHRDQATERLIARGLTPEEARHERLAASSAMSITCRKKHAMRA
jgi:hypothetical protein